MLEWRLKAFRHWSRIAGDEPTWANIDYPPINYQDIIYYSAPKQKVNPKILMKWIRTASHVRKTGYFAGRAEAPEWRGCGCGD
jgi:hypothetical protein